MEARQPKKTFHFLMERPLTPIYERINRAFKDALEELGHRVTYFDHTQFESYNQALKYFFERIASKVIDYCLITSTSKVFYSYFQDAESYLFELIKAKLVFIHHDDISNIFIWESDFRLTLQAWHRVKDRSIHFCLEYSNFIDLKFLGFEQVYPIRHGSEFKRINSPQEYAYTVSFVGHVVPELENSFNVLPYSHQLYADFWTRLVNLDKKIKPSAISFSNQMRRLDNSRDFFEQKFFYIAAMNPLSPCFRGELITRLIAKLDNINIDIFGGDPSYLQGYSYNRLIDHKNIKYHRCTDYFETKYIYANSKINLNITSLQFDDAIVNRVIDVGAVGGFILTDWKPGLKNITSVYKEISYKTLDELNYKINYYLSHEEERLKIAEKLHQDIVSRCTYSQVVNFIFSKISLMSTHYLNVLRLDLGCGSRKPEGFVGVDNYPWSEVDVIADLNEDFPFPDNSVDEVRANAIIEHLQDKIHTMNEIWRICKPNAIVNISVPSTDGRGAFQDPTHISFWNINSFKYYCIEFPEYINLCRSYGFQGAFKIISLEQEESLDQVIHVKAILQVIKSNESQLSEDIIKKLKLREINLVTFPDWLQPEELLLADLTDVIRKLGVHPDKSKLTLLIDTRNSNNCEIDPEVILSSIIINLSLNEELDTTEDGLEISLIPDLTSKEWEALFQKLYGRVILNNEERESLEVLKSRKIGAFKLDDIANLRM
jgi:SAM-dependent methyltransferase